ncbi:hypothetical protein D3C85_1167980 [compost metagenome]
MFWNVIVMFSFFVAAGVVVAAPAAGEVVLELLPPEPHAVKLMASKLAPITCSALYFFTNVNPPRLSECSLCPYYAVFLVSLTMQEL